MNNMNYNITSAEAMAAAIRHTASGAETVFDRQMTAADGLYEISFRTTFMSYEVYIDAANGEVLGCDFCPVRACEAA